MLSLPDVTLCCIDTRLPRLALDAMRACMAQARFGEALLFTWSQHGLHEFPDGLRIIEADEICNIEAYSRFLIKGLAPYVRTSHVLIVQWDGYVLDAAMWQDNFLDWDYIGAVWPQYSDAHRVGNGGFSLRSRQLLDALMSDDIVPHHPEDVCIARTHRSVLEQRHGIRFAPEEVAHRFAFERERRTPSSFGFHGMSNMALCMGEAEIAAFMAGAPASLFGSVEARGFIKQLIRRGLNAHARHALQMRKAAKPLDLADLRLWARLTF